MRRFFRFLLYRPVMWAASRFSSKPDRQRIFQSLANLRENILQKPGQRGLVIPFAYGAGKFIIFSDQHRGGKNGADDFRQAEPNYLAALDHYSQREYCLINLGDSEELWENSIWRVKKKNKISFLAEKKFIEHNRYIKLFGNHDLFWDNDPLSRWHLKDIFGEKVEIYEGVVLKTEVGSPVRKDSFGGPGAMATGSRHRSKNTELTIFLTHGHQGDAQSDGNWFSKFFVANIWAPLQAFLRINPNTPAYDGEKKSLHNSIMYEWAASQKNLLLITGHTHQPVFTSLTHLERLYKKYQLAQKNMQSEELETIAAEIRKREKEFTAVSVDYMSMIPSYFNSGCCCYDDGDITGIEIAEGEIRLVKWKQKGGQSEREVLESLSLQALADRL